MISTLSLIVYFIISLVSIWTVGFGLLFLLKIHIAGFYLRSFASCLSGLLLMITMFAIIKTSGITVFSLVAVSCVFLYLNRPSGSMVREEESKIDYVYIAFFAMISFGWQFLIYYREGGFFLPMPDEVFYAKLSMRLLQSGAENYYGATDFGYFLNETTPYHYFEIWMDSIWYEAFSINTLVSRLFLSTPILLFVLFLGFASIVELEKGKSKWLLILLPFWGGLYFDFYKMIPMYRYLSHGVSVLNPICFSKIIPLYFLVILSYIFYRKENYILMVVCLLSTIFLNVGMAPAILGGLFVWSLFFNKSKERRNYILLQVACVLMFGAFYLLTQGKHSLKMSDFLFFKSDTPGLILFLKTFVVYVSQYVLVYIPWLILVAIYWKSIATFKELKSIVFLFLAMIVMGGVAWCLLFLQFDAKQFFTIPLTIVIHVIFSAFLVYIVDAGKIKSSVVFVVGVLFAVYSNYIYKESIVEHENQYSQEFISEIGKELEIRQNRPIKGGVLLSDNIKILAPDLFSTGNFLYYFTSEIKLTNLSAIEMFQNIQKDSYFTSPGKSFLPLVPIYNFEEENKTKGIQSKVEFAKKYGLDVLIFSGKYQIEKEWSEFSEKVIVDPTTQEKIMFLKR